MGASAPDACAAAAGRVATEGMSPLQTRDERFVAWSAARAEANVAYDEWCTRPGAEAYLVYRAAEERADAAERDLILASRLLLTA